MHSFIWAGYCPLALWPYSLPPFLTQTNLKALMLSAPKRLRPTDSIRSPSLISSTVLSRIASLLTNFLVWSPAPLISCPADAACGNPILLILAQLYDCHSCYDERSIDQKKKHAETRSFLRLRISQVDWLGDSSSTTLDTLHSTPVKVIPPFTRLAILRWSTDSECGVVVLVFVCGCVFVWFRCCFSRFQGNFCIKLVFNFTRVFSS